MKTIGILGGMSWESTADYYALLNRGVRDALGHPHSARLLIHSMDFAAIGRMQHDGEWAALGALLAQAAAGLERGGAEAIVLATNTMHCVAPAIEAAIGVPFLHIADAAGAAVRAAGIARVGLLGTGFTMEQGFYRERLAERFGLEVLVPEAEDRAMIHRVIYEELTAGIVRPESADAYRAAVDRLAARGAQGVILGCTEIVMLVGEDALSLPAFDTSRLHAEAALAFALEGRAPLAPA